MIKRRIIRCTALLLCLAVLCGLGGLPAWADGPDAEAMPWGAETLPPEQAEGGAAPPEEGEAAEPTVELPPPMEVSRSLEDTYGLEYTPPHGQLFTNRVDGYEITLPGDFTVDMTKSDVCAVLGNDAWKLEIYRQELSGVSPLAYINYSNRFIANTADHGWEYGVSESVNGYMAHVMQWSRRDLAALDRDFNHYACVNIVAGSNLVYTFFFKADDAFWGPEQYMEMVRSFRQVYPTRTAYTVMTQGPADREEWDELTRYAFDTLFGAEAGLSWGLFEHAAPMHMQRVNFIEKNLEFKFPIQLLYIHFGEEDTLTQLETALANVKAEGRIMELTLQTVAQPAEQGNMVYDVLDKEHDDYLQRLAELIAANRQPVLFRLGNEMNGDWCPYSAWHTSRDAEVYRAFSRYVYDRLEEYGAGPWLIRVWNPNERSYPDFKWNHAGLYYPAEDDMDVIGLTGYNTGTYYPSETWRSFDEIYAPLYEEAVARHAQPLMITEFSCSSVGGDKVQWVQDMFASIADYPRIKAAVWWSGRDLDAQGNIARPYWIDDNRLMTFYLKRGFDGLEAGWLSDPAPPEEAKDEFPFKLFL
ncbi:MAG: glycosyl hydrolase [Syntrophomonadaceae bacterium]|nr:glycosyl hydrolase [Syntrophomonadaceae bacterium]